MMLVEQTTVPTSALPVAEFKDHLRLGTGFADDGLQDSVLETYLRAALAAIEARTGKILLQRSFSWTLTGWRELARQALPVAPVSEITEVRIVDQGLVETVVAPETYRLEKDMQRPRLVATTYQLPPVPHHAHVEVRFDAGFGLTWEAIPADLGQAVFLLAAHYYENRSVLSPDEAVMPWGVSLLIDRYRTVRLFGEGSR